MDLFLFFSEIIYLLRNNLPGRDSTFSIHLPKTTVVNVPYLSRNEWLNQPWRYVFIYTEPRQLGLMSFKITLECHCFYLNDSSFIAFSLPSLKTSMDRPYCHIIYRTFFCLASMKWLSLSKHICIGRWIISIILIHMAFIDGKRSALTLNRLGISWLSEMTCCYLEIQDRHKGKKQHAGPR